ncbi:SNARE associated Golgi protein [Gracilaria domingensis]|nr:SNARE associated Golgi protein [Gracilaria domingensis]
MRRSPPLLFVYAVSGFPTPLLRRVSIERPTQRVTRLRRVCAARVRMSSEVSGESTSMCKKPTPSYGTSELVPEQHSEQVPSPSNNSPTSTSSTATTAGETDFRLVAAFGFLAISLVLGSVAAATGLFSPDTLVQLARWFEQLGPSAIYLYGVLYFVLELVAVPALPLTLGSGYLFGLTDGAIAVSIASTLAATAAFLIARYGFRARVSRFAYGSARFRVLDRAIGREGFKFVLLLRLSPLLPFSISNYLYGLTSVKLGEYALASWLGMLPGTIAYVSAGAAVNTLTDLHGGQSAASPALVITGLVATAAVLISLGKIAREAIENVEEEDVPEQ